MEPVIALLVEDDEDDYILTRSLLTEIDPNRFVLEWLKSFDEAAERIPRGGFDVCLIDYRLGARDGLELLRLARDHHCKAPLILLTGQGDQEIDLAAMCSGAADYLIKGQITPPLLDRSIRYAIQHRRMEEERVRLAREQEARIQAEAANRAKDQFIAMVSHELRNPLNAVLGWVTLLSSGRLDPAAQARAIEAIERNARTQTRLIDDLLDIGRIVAGNLRLDFQPASYPRSWNGPSRPFSPPPPPRGSGSKPAWREGPGCWEIPAAFSRSSPTCSRTRSSSPPRTAGWTCASISSEARPASPSGTPAVASRTPSCPRSSSPFARARAGRTNARKGWAWPRHHPAPRGAARRHHPGREPGRRSGLSLHR